MAKTIKFEEKSKFFNKVVKIKKFVILGDARAIVFPKSWLDAMNWDRNSKIVLEVLPYSEKIILSKYEEDSKPTERID